MNLNLFLNNFDWGGWLLTTLSKYIMMDCRRCFAFKTIVSSLACLQKAVSTMEGHDVLVSDVLQGRNQHKYPASTPFILLLPIENCDLWSRVLGYLWFLKRKDTLFLFKNRHKYPHKYPTPKSQFSIAKATLFSLGAGTCVVFHV